MGTATSTDATFAIARQLAGFFEESFRRHLEGIPAEEIEGMGPMEAATYIVAEARKRAAEEAGLSVAAPRGRATTADLDKAWGMVCKGQDTHSIAEIVAATGVSTATVLDMRAGLETITGSKDPNEWAASLKWGEAREAAAEVLGVSITTGGIYTMRKVAEEKRQAAEAAERRRTRVFSESPNWTPTDTAHRLAAEGEE